MTVLPRGERFGTLQRDLPFLKDVIDYRLTRHPRFYLFVERFRTWVNWDKRVYLSFVRKGDFVLDVGANVGAHAIFLSHLVGEEGSVLAFEPLPSNVDALHETIERRSRIANIHIIQTAVGNPDGSTETATMRSPEDDLTQASLHPQSAGSWQGARELREFTVSLIALDALKEVRDLRQIHFIKIDVEGGELDVLKGARTILRKHHPLVYCEVYQKWLATFGYVPGDLFHFMATMGYDGARAISKGKVTPLLVDEPVPNGLFDTSSDVLFFTEQHSAMVAAFDKRYLE